MLQVTVPAKEMWDDKNCEFITLKEQTLQMEHSLVSLSKWESKWCKPFLGTDKSIEELIDYIRFMTTTRSVDPNVYFRLTDKNLSDIREYIESPMTATVFSDRDSRPSREVITSELIYYWMITLGIPFECQKWHLNRLLTLIKVCNIKNSPPKKMSRSEMLKNRTELNAARRKKLNSKG